MKRTVAGIFLLAASTLLFELALTRLFSVLFFHHFAFLIISTALFGFGLSGLYLFVRHDRPKRDPQSRFALWTLAYALLIPVTLRIILMLPYGFQELFDKPLGIIRLVATYALLAVPLFCAGCAITLILKTFSEQSGLLYGWDLAGAALGCIAALFLVPVLGGQGAVLSSSVLAAFASVIFWPRSRAIRIASILVVPAAIVILFYSQAIFPLQLSRIFEEKRGNFFGAPKRKVEFSAWSPISRIDVIKTDPSRLIYLDGGSNVSFLEPFDGKIETLQPALSWRTIPYRLTHRSDVCIIGPGGGEDVLLSLSYKPNSIVAVEMDPLILDLLRGPYREFTGGIIDAPSVQWINEEGRSYLRRSGRQFDLIQTVHNCANVALASGALNLTESYLFTVEAFNEYWHRLKPGGMLAINRSAILRAASLASVVLQHNGIADPQNYVMVTTRRGSGGDTGFYLKKGRVTEQEVDVLHEAASDARIRVVYAPSAHYQTDDNLYYRLLNPSTRDLFIRNADVDLTPSTDDRPFFDHYQHFGSFRRSTTVLPEELNPSLRYYNLGDLALLTLLGEALLFSSVFLGLPLLRLHKRATFSRGAILLYFSALGAGFILVEISLFQKHILFLGQPVYSISAVLFSLLLSAGAGSWLLQSRMREGSEAQWLARILALLAVMLLLEALMTPFLFQRFLGAGKIARFCISGLMIAPLGLLMGMPFPLGIKVLGRRDPDLIPLAWGLNAYMTVVGSIASVILAILFGFRVNFLIALLAYAGGLSAMLMVLKRYRSGDA